MRYKKRKMRNKNKRGGGDVDTVPTVEYDPRGKGPPKLRDYTDEHYGHNDPLRSKNNTIKLVGKIVTVSAIIGIGIWLLLKFKK